MKKFFALLLTLALVLTFVACKKSDSTQNTNNSNQGAQSNNTSDAHGSETTPRPGDGYGEYTADGEYITPEKIDGKDVLYHGSYTPETGVSVTVTDAGENARNNANVEKPNNNQSGGVSNNNEKETEKEYKKESGKESEEKSEKETEATTEEATENVNPPAEDIYKKALASQGSYNCKIDFCYYVDMDDGWHESHPSSTEISYDASSDSYIGKSTDSGADNTATYAKGIYTSPDGSKSESSIDVFFRQCNHLTPLSLSAYNFTVTSDKTVVSAFLQASDYRYKLMMASNFFKGYEKENRSDIAMGDLVYTAELSPAGKLISTEFDYTFTVYDKNIGDLHITVVAKTKYE